MPLLHRKPFVRQKPPADLQPDEEVFLCKITHEIFRTYDEFFERTILCNSLVWSCALTSRSGLTYLEAVESERRARHSLQNYPPVLLLPLLHLAVLSNRCRLSELCEDVYLFVKDRFFPGEKVDVIGRNGARQVCEILQVIPPKGSLVANGHTKSNDHDTIVISDSDDEHDDFLSSPVMVNGKKRKPLNPSSFKYTVKTNDLSEPFTVGAKQIVRKKSMMSRERLKLLFKQHCECVNGMVAVKSTTVAKYGLSEQTFTHFFPEEPPLFPSKPAGLSSPGQARLAAEEKMRLLQHREAMASAGHERAQFKKGKEDTRRKEKEDKDKQREEQRRCFEEEKQKKREEQRKWFEEEKQKRREDKERKKLEKEREREKIKEEKKKYAEQLKLWNKPREDLECEDLKELPSPSPVKTRLPAEHFGEALMVLEFLQAFGDAFDLKDEFPEGVSLETMEEALVGSNPEGPLCEMLFFFLSAIFQALDEEREEVAKEAEEILEPLDDNTNPTDSALSAVASLAAAWPQLHQGSTLKQLDLDSCTLTEILRLHILASGADCNLSNANFRYRKQGGFTLMDDPCVQLRLSEPALMKKLSSSTVYDLTAGEKLRILQALIGKLLTLESSRDLIEYCVEDQRAAKQELREIRSEQHRREREEAAYRVRLRKEERLREQEQRMKEKEEKLKEQEFNGKPQASGAADDADQHNLSNITKEKDEQHPSDSGPGVGPPSSLTPEELEAEQEKVRELQERIQKAASCTSLMPLGRDRMYRRYWLLPSASALFVEEDSFGLTEDMLQPHPKPAMDTTAEVEEGDLPKEEVAEGSAGSSPAPQHSHSPPVNRPNQWSFYSSLEEVDHLIEALNPRGHRESSLREALLQERDRLQQLLPSCDRSKYRHSDDPESSRSVPECTAAAETVMEIRLRDLLLDIEDRIHQGSLGTLKTMDRKLWRSALESGNYEGVCPIGQEDMMEVDGDVKMAKDGRAPVSGSTTPLVQNGAVGRLAQALAQIELGIERRFLRAPLGDDDSKKEVKKKSNNKKKDESLPSDDVGDSGRTVKTVLDRWRESLLSCSSLSQVFVHLSTLERGIIWARSVKNARCRICRRKGDADNMLLCDGCDRGHHTHCLRPRLKVIPEGDWFCPDCRPKQRSSHFSSRKRTYVEEDEEEMEEDDEEEEEDESEEEDVSEDDEDEESVEERVVTKKGQAPPSKSKSRPAPPTKGKSQPTPPPKGKGQNATPKTKKAVDFKTPTPTKSSGKKSPPTKGASSSSKAPTRSSSRNSSSNQGSQGPTSNTPDSQDSRKRSGKDVASLPKPVLPSSSSSSSNRRSSGRNHGVHELSACEQLIVDLVRHDDSWPFMKLVSRTQVPDYYDIIQKPIALSIIRERVNNCEYKTADEFVSDVELMFTNCFQYNQRNTNEAKAGQRLQQFFHSQLNRLGLSGLDKTSPPAKRSRN